MMEQMKNQWYMGVSKLQLTKLFAKMMALGWYEYEQAKENLAMPKKIEDDKSMAEFYKRLVKKDEKENHRLEGGI